MQQISDYWVYLNNMKNGVYDKLFFTDKIFEEWNTFLDIGCADGFLTNTIQELYPSKQIIGYDVDGEMKKKKKTSYPNILFTSAFFNADVLYLSSVVHEIYTYLNSDEIESFWKMIFDSKYKYIVIRDMFYGDYLNSKPITTNENFRFIKFIQNQKLENKLFDFEQIWGKITTYKQLIHFLLKYQYNENWNREVRENYLPISYNDFLKVLPLNVKIDYLEQYTLPYFKNKWEKEIGIEIDDEIHCKIIIKKI